MTIIEVNAGFYSFFVRKIENEIKVVDLPNKIKETEIKERRAYFETLDIRNTSKKRDDQNWIQLYEKSRNDNTI